MKKGWKIALISLGSLIGTIAIVVAVACWLLFTPARLTSIVNKLSDKYLLCENHFGKVSLSLFKTWPDAGLEVEGLTPTACPKATHWPQVPCKTTHWLG